jgi:hypothetical protein
MRKTRESVPNREADCTCHIANGKITSNGLLSC